MADIDLIKVDPRALLDSIKGAYYDQTGETLQIGSPEFAAGSVFSYVWSVLLGNINNATLNRFIDSATGEYLDAIASNYGIDKRPDGYHATSKFYLIYISEGVVIPAYSIVVQDSSGNRFTNRYALSETDTETGVFSVLYAIESGTKYNGIPADSITEIVEGSAYISSASNVSMTEGGTDSMDGNDDAFREWLKMEIQSFAGAGTYQAYEARAKNADPRVKDVYVFRQDDPGYQKGKVTIKILTDSSTDFYDEVLEIVRHSCEDPSFRPIGDYVMVGSSMLQSYDVGATIQVTYPKRFNGVATTRTNRILTEYISYLQEKINRPFVFEELCSWLTKKDDDGVYAIDAKPVDLDDDAYLTPIYPDVGKRLNPQNITFDIQFSNLAGA